MTPAQIHLQKLVDAAKTTTSPKTLVQWRLENPDIIQVLQEFAAATHSNNELLDQVQGLFDQLNPLLAQQEQPPQPNVSKCANEVAVVFGGKYAPHPRSISEALVAQLVQHAPRVYTVSRSMLSLQESSVPTNLAHIPKQHLDGPDGANEFQEVLAQACSTISLSATTQPQNMALYFTLGQHKGIDPFQRNVQAARNFCRALEQTTTTTTTARWRVIVTGTDATLPSNRPDGQRMGFQIPTYKIMEYNYTYAMSKLAQYYWVAHTIAKLRMPSKPELVERTRQRLDKLEEHLAASGEDGDYHESTAIVKMNELDEFSREMDQIENELKDHFMIAKEISICYTPLHAKPWAEQAVSKSEDMDARAYILEQVVKRFKNAISIDQAVACHFPSSPAL